MNIALVNGQRHEAEPDLSGECPGCGTPMVAKCGDFRRWHWAHKADRHCDRWWEPETKWHRDWKNRFPVECQEIVHRAGDGERHIADVKTRDGWVLEFQHSKIRPDERRSREAFYQGLIWVVDGTRRKRDAAQFSRAPGESPYRSMPWWRISSPKGALLQEWAGSPAHVFFDFGGEQLWWLFPHSDDMRAYVQHLSRAQFVRVHQESHTHGPTEFDSLVQTFSAFIAHYEPPPSTARPQRATEIPPQPHLRPMIRRSFRL